MCGDHSHQLAIVIENGDLHLPVGKPVKVLLRSVDVLHDFYVPEFRAKMVMVPGMVTYFLDPVRDIDIDQIQIEIPNAPGNSLGQPPAFDLNAPPSFGDPPAGQPAPAPAQPPPDLSQPPSFN